MRLRIEVDAERPLFALRNAGKQVQRGRRLADAALLVEYRNDGHRRSLQDALTHDGDDDLRENYDCEDREQDRCGAVPWEIVQRPSSLDRKTRRWAAFSHITPAGRRAKMR